MDILVVALSINLRPLSALELKLWGLIMESRVDTAGDNQNVYVIISNDIEYQESNCNHLLSRLDFVLYLSRGANKNIFM